MVHKDDNAVSRLVAAGSGIYGNIVGASVGGLVGGAPGVFLGAAAAPVLSAVAEWTASVIWPRLSRRGAERAGAAFLCAEHKLQQLIEAGEEIRNDGFFDGDVAESSGAEIIEAVLLAAQREHEERKLRFYGNLLAEIAVSSEVNRGFANWLIRMADELSYRQLCLLAIVHDHDQFELRDNLRRPGDSWEQQSVLEELAELGYGRLEWVGVVSSQPGLPTNIGLPNAQRLKHWGTYMYKAMHLEEIPRDDLAEVAELLT